MLSGREPQDIYAEQLRLLGYGLPLWQPTPLADYEKINIGDVGYVFQGSFHRLFNATLPSTHPKNSNIPRDFCRLDLDKGGGVTNKLPRFPNVLHTGNITSQKLGVTASATGPSGIGAGGGFTFNTKEQSGAILITRDETERESAVPIRWMEEYAIKHAESWFELACEKEYAMAAFSHMNTDVTLTFDATVPVISGSVSVWGSWQTESTVFVHRNCGPHVEQPRSPTLGTGIQLLAQEPEHSVVSQEPLPSPDTSKRHQCVMIKGIRVEKRLLFPKKIRAAAGPHDLQPGPRQDELTPMVYDGSSTASNDGSIVIVETTSAFRDPLTHIFEYLFANSDAQIAIVHDDDLQLLINTDAQKRNSNGQALALPTDIQSLINNVAPPVVYGRDGVARLNTAESEFRFSYTPGKSTILPGSPVTLFGNLKDTNEDTAHPHSDSLANPSNIDNPKNESSLKSNELYFEKKTVSIRNTRVTLSPSPWDLLVDLHHDESVIGSDDKFVQRGPNGMIVSGTIHGLVTQLITDTGDLHADDNFKKEFLVSYKAFTTSNQLLQLLLNEYESLSSTSDTAERRTGMRYSLITFLKLWLNGKYLGPEDAPILTRMRIFAAALERSSAVSGVFYFAAQALIQLINQQANIPLSRVPSNSSPHHASTFDSPILIPPKLLARILTTMMSDNFRRINEVDCFRWLQGPDPTNAVSSFTSECNKLGLWAQKAILSPNSRSERKTNLKYFISVIQECRKLSNFASAYGLLGGLDSLSITGLKRTFRGLSRKSINIFKTELKSMSPKANFRRYRLTVSKLNGVCLPWLHVHLEDLRQEGNAHPVFVYSHDRKNLVNFERCRRIRVVISELLGYTVPDVGPLDRSSYAATSAALVATQLHHLADNEVLRLWLKQRIESLNSEENFGWYAHRHITLGSSSSPNLDPVPTFSIELPVSFIDSSASTYMPVTESNKTASKIVPTDVTFSRQSQYCLDGRIKSGLYPERVGGYSDIYMGDFEGQKVAIKVLRVKVKKGVNTPKENLLEIERLRREYMTWIGISHPLILPCFGFCFQVGSEVYELPCLISPWMANGSLNEYMKGRSDFDRLTTLANVGEALSFLHESKPPVIHGDIRGTNILVSAKGLPYISDFGLSYASLSDTTISGEQHQGALRWMCPELIMEARPSTESDVWSFGMTILEIMSGRRPYSELINEVQVVLALSRQQLPLRPAEIMGAAPFNEEVWAICQKCWHFDPRQRPAMREVYAELRSIFLGGRTKDFLALIHSTHEGRSGHTIFA